MNSSAVEHASEIMEANGSLPVTYDAFISYSHAKDKPLAMALQAVVQRTRQAVVSAAGVAIVPG